MNKLNKEFFNAMHSSSWSTKIKMGSFFCFEKINAKLEEIPLAKDTFDLIYWDAFNPDLQPELWSEEIFRKMYLAMKDEGVLITYSAKGKVKRALKAAGFTLYALPGPPGKREITQALKII